MPKIHEKPEGLGDQPAKPIAASYNLKPSPPRTGPAEARTLIELLREYTEKFQQWSLNAETAKLHRLIPLGAELASRASQLIEYGGLEDLTRFELKFRLEEFEMVLLGAKGVTPKSA